jgi:hypothetical protein
VLNQRAEPVQVLRAETGASLTNLAFGRPERKTLFCTESTSGSILCTPMDHAGRMVQGGWIESAVLVGERAAKAASPVPCKRFGADASTSDPMRGSTRGTD